MKYLLDTCVVSDFVKGEKNTLGKIKTTLPKYIAVSSITLMEIRYGLALHPNVSQKIGSILEDFLSSITILDFRQNDAKEAGKIRAVLQQQGKPIGSYDYLLAGTAVCNQLIFVTSNTKEFRRIPGLVLEDWRLL